MTARTTTLQGPDAGAYYIEKELGYYLDAGEPPGIWHGDGAAALGLHGSIIDDDFLAVMDGLDPHTAELLGTKHTDRTVRGFDVTCSAPKSVSVLFAVGDESVRREALEAHDAAVTAVVAWIEQHAHTRFRVQGEVCTFDADGIVAACFRQHTSRALDPQLHTHVVIANRVKAPDGRWLALDARTIKRDQQTLSRLYHAGLRAELTRRMGVRWAEPRNGIAEIADVPEDVLIEFSQRTRVISDRIDDKIDAFVETFDRQPTPRERWRLEREAAAEDRPEKTDTDPVALENDWRRRVVDLGIEPALLIEKTVGAQTDIALSIDVETLTDDALAALGERQSTWRRAELVRELAAAVPTNVAAMAGLLPPALDRLADQIIAERMVELSAPIPEDMPLRRDGRPVTEAAIDRRLTLPEILEQEERLILAAGRRLNEAGEDRRVPVPDELTIPQRQLAAAVAGVHQLVLAVGPAGSGKTTALAPAAEQLRRAGRGVFGVAPSAAAAEVLGDEVGIDADTIDKLLIEHRLDRPPEHRYDLPAATTIFVDEAGMLSTARMAEMFDLADRKGWRLAVVGDPLQFAPVGRGGMFGLLVDTFGSIDLDRIHRFHQSWERAASLQLRSGDASVVEIYDEHDRLHGGTARQMQRAVVQAWWDAIADGKTASMMASTNEAVIALNQRAQRLRHEGGQLDADRSLIVGPYEIRVGDLISTRDNNRRIRTDRNLMVKNRDHWTVEQIHPDGGLTASGKTGHIRLPAAYVAENVELAYAETSHANQGRTVDRSLLYLDGPTDCRGIYVPLSRGRDTNEAFVVLHGEETAADVIADALSRDWIDQPALQVQAELRRPGGDALEPQQVELRPLERSEVRQLVERNTELTRALNEIRTERQSAHRDLDAIVAERLRLQRTLENLEARLVAADDTIAEHDRPLHRRGHRTELDAARGQVQQIPDEISATKHELATLDRRDKKAGDRLIRAEQLEKQTPHLMAEHTIIEHQLERDVEARGRRVAMRPPAAIVDRLGPFPENAKHASLWIDVVGKLAQHSVAFEEPGVPAVRRDARTVDDAFTVSYRSSVQAMQRLDRALEQERFSIEPPSVELGLSL